MKSLLVLGVVVSSVALAAPAEEAGKSTPSKAQEHGKAAPAKAQEPAQSFGLKRPQPIMNEQLPAKKSSSVQPTNPSVKATPKASPAAQPAAQQQAIKPAAQQPKPALSAQQTPPAKTQGTPRPTIFQNPKPQVPASQVPPAKPVVQAGSMRPQVILQRYPQIRNYVEVRGAAYRAAYHERLVFLQQRYLAPTYFVPLRLAYRPWFRVGFYAYAYPVHPVVEFYTYFSNPCVAWFYNDYDAEFYQPFYGQYIARYPDLGRGYVRAGIYLPTDEFMSLNVSISEMPILAQVHYRRGMIYLGDRLAERYRLPIGRHQVIVNHYQMLPNRRAVVVEGFVDNEQVQMPFKAMVDLHNADNSMLFSVNSWRAEDVPSSDQSEDLFDLNDQITEYGGTIEPVPAS